MSRVFWKIEKIKHSAMIELFVKKGLVPMEIYNGMGNVLGDTPPSKTYGYKKKKKFVTGNSSLNVLQKRWRWSTQWTTTKCNNSRYHLVYDILNSRTVCAKRFCKPNASHFELSHFLGVHVGTIFSTHTTSLNSSAHLQTIIF